MHNPFSQHIFNSIFRLKDGSENILKTRESNTIEFKEGFNWANKHKYAKTMAAFANREGGYLIFGIKDSPHEIVGLKNDNFEKMDEEKITSYLNDVMSPEVNWDKTVIEVSNKLIGLIYIKESNRKPIISKKNDENIKEAEIYYRYRGRSEKIKYPELRSLIDNELNKERRLWIKHFDQVSKSGINNIALLDMNNKTIEGQGGTILIDEKLLKDIEFIKEGEFNEVEGAKTLKLVGNISSVKGSTVLPIKTKYKNIGTREMYESLLYGKLHENTSAEEYLEHLIDESSKNVPIYIYRKLGGYSNEELIEILSSIQTTKIAHRKKILGRLQEGKKHWEIALDNQIVKQNIYFNNIMEFERYLKGRKESNIIRRALVLNLITNKGIEAVNFLAIKYAEDILGAITHLDKQYLIEKKDVVAELMLGIYDTHFSELASTYRVVTCFIDEELYM